MNTEYLTTSAVVTPAPMVAMTTIPGAINAAHARVIEAGRSTLLFAKEAGEHLLKAKDLVAHGRFKAWVEENCECSYRQAMKYMAVAKVAPQGNFDPEVGINAFLAAHATPRTKAPDAKLAEAAAPDSTSTSSEEDGGGQLPGEMGGREEDREEVSALREEVARLTSELQASRDALATAEAHIETLKARDALATAPVSDEVEGLRAELAEAEEFFDQREATLKASVEGLREELKAMRLERNEAKRLLQVAVEASPAARHAVESNGNPHGEHDGEHPWDF